MSLLPCYNTDPNVYEISLDECGRGPLFGRVYAAAVNLPPPESEFRFDWMKDSKKIHSPKKMSQLAEYIKANAIAYSIQYADVDTIDRVNILQADMQCMHECIRDILPRVDKPVTLLIDGNYFKPYTLFDEVNQEMVVLPHTTIEQGDNTYANIAAASILAKNARDVYIAELCAEHPFLVTNYAIDRNKGYGTKAHMDGIKQHGITQWHRKSFKPCQGVPMYTPNEEIV